MVNEEQAQKQQSQDEFIQDVFRKGVDILKYTNNHSKSSMVIKLMDQTGIDQASAYAVINKIISSKNEAYKERAKNKIGAGVGLILIALLIFYATNGFLIAGGAGIYGIINLFLGLTGLSDKVFVTD